MTTLDPRALEMAAKIRANQDTPDFINASHYRDEAAEIITAYLASQSQPQAGEPVAWQRKHPEHGWIDVRDVDRSHYERMGQETRPLYASPPPSGEVEALRAAWLLTGGPDGQFSKVVFGLENLKREAVAAVFGDGDDVSEEAQDMRDRLDTPGDWEGDRWSISWSFEDGYLNAQRITDLSSLSSAPATADGWRPISEAPKDGTNVLYRNRFRDIGFCHWDEGYDEDDQPCWWDNEADQGVCPVVWLPADTLPAFPAAPTATGGR